MHKAQIRYSLILGLMFITLVCFRFVKAEEVNIFVTTKDYKFHENYNQPQSVKVSKNTNKKKGHDQFLVKSIKTAGGWGYQIIKNNKVMINQPTIPVIEGNKAFSTEKDALKVAGLVKANLEKGHFPPTVSKSQLDSLKITY
ncbi:MAG: DUF4907 domain-containing protein [Sphingobacteriia bacterium]|nr:DUF4907 domain-containing protein [Sphingobacteriia bacterium]